MKKFLVFLLVIITVTSQAQNRMTVSFTDSSVAVEIKGKTVVPGFAPDMHHPFELTFKKTGSIYQAALPDFQRGVSSGKFGSIIYQISAGVVPRNLDQPLTVTVVIPKGKTLIWGGRIWSKGKVKLTFSDYFQAREFPIILVSQSNYLMRSSRFNKIDSLNAVYVWDDSLSQAALPKAFQAVDTAALRFGYFAPTYLDKYVMRYFSPAGKQKKNYLLVYFITSRMIVTGSEHYNQPFIVTPLRYISEEGVSHTLFHSLIGKAIMPRTYRQESGHYFPANSLGFYEGLTTYLTNRYVRDNFSASFSALIYRAKLRTDLQDLEEAALDFKFESYYGKGYLYWIYLEANGLNVELFAKCLFGIWLINSPFPTLMDWHDVIRWLTLYDKKIGLLAEEAAHGGYLNSVFQILKTNGWKPIPVHEVPRWYDLYIGPYAVTPGGINLPTDNYPETTAYPVYLINTDGSKLKIEPKKDNAALLFIKAHPDSSFQIEFSDSTRCLVANKLKFKDGSPYFMHGEISSNDSNINFWKKLNVYFKKN